MENDTSKDVLSILLEEGLINEADADQARRRQRRARCTIQDALVDLGSVSQESIYRAVAEMSELPFIFLSEAELKKDVIDSVPRKVILRYKFVPLALDKGVMEAAFSNPPAIREVSD